MIEKCQILTEFELFLPDIYVFRDIVKWQLEKAGQ